MMTVLVLRGSGEIDLQLPTMLCCQVQESNAFADIYYIAKMKSVILFPQLSTRLSTASLEATYATTGSVSVAINASHIIFGFETQMLEAAKKLWTFLEEQGASSKTRIVDIFDMTTEILGTNMEKQVDKVYDFAGKDVSIFYPATLKTATGSVTINVDPSCVTSSRETKILEAAQKMWAFIGEAQRC